MNEAIEAETEMIGDFDFNRDDDRKLLGCQRRIINISRCGEVVSLSFEMGRREGDIITVMLNLNEFLICLGRLKI